MSKHSAKQNYTQLMEWLETVKRPKKSSTPASFQQQSRLDYYKQKGNK
jgi:hypothetical protein